YTTESEQSPILRTLGRQMLSNDGEGRREAKTFATESFTVPALERTVAPAVREWVASWVAGLRDPGSSTAGRPGGAARDGEVELMSSLASPLAIDSVCLAMGLPPADRDRLRAWYEALAAALANLSGAPEPAARGEAAAAELCAYLERRLDAAAGRGGTSLVERFADADRERWPVADVLSNLMIVLFGGIETTESMIGNALWCLLQHGDPERTREGPEALSRIIEESLRWEPAVQSCSRWATRPARLRGVEIGTGEGVQCMLGAANRDPRRWTNPERFDPERPDAGDHLAFGAGRHFCLGAHLARMETAAAVAGVVGGLPGLRLDPTRSSAPRGYEFRKPPRLWVRWRPDA
ncbi:MAG: cytochrome P450, partial [Thermoanaerobaculia bacterium]|nr:cytochrome P450 [Thermoanaerobaculia bacterium]